MITKKFIFILRLILILRLNLIKSVYYSKKLRGNRSKQALLIFGKNLLSINETASIDCLDNAKFYFNKPMNSPELFPGMLEMYKSSKIIVKDNFTIHSGAHIILKENAVLTLGSGYINRNCRIKCFNQINIGKDVAISENVSMWDSDVHDTLGSKSEILTTIDIGDHVWIGTNSIILKGVTIGSGSIIGAGSVVNRSIPQNCLAAGVPARIIRRSVRWN